MNDGAGFTLEIARRAAGGRDGFDDRDVRRLVGQCLLDWLACAIGGVIETASRICSQTAIAEGAAPVATIVGSSTATSPVLAARANGVISHALDFDDANLTLPGHPGVVLFPALLALAEARRASGRELADAFLAGYDAACRIGASVAPGHYARGFHATGTIGTFAAAAACGRLLGLDPTGMRCAIGIAATQASGLVSMFGTDAKPLHAGNAAANGLSAALLAAKGLRAREDSIECALGFAATHGPDFNAAAGLAAPRLGHHIRDNLFKVHAACYGTHATIECARTVSRTPGFRPDRVRSVWIGVGEECIRTCDIRQPSTGAQAKFSLRFNAAAGLLGHPTQKLSTYSEEKLRDAAIVALRDKVDATFVPGRPLTVAEMRVTLDDGMVFQARADSSVPCADLDLQETVLQAKFDGLVAPFLAPTEAADLRGEALDVDATADISPLMRRLRFECEATARHGQAFSRQV